MRLLKACLLVITVLLTFPAAQAQEKHTEDYKWNSEPKPFEFTGFEEEELVVVKHYRSIEILYKEESNNPVQNYLVHKRVWLNSDDAIDGNNKVYIPIGEEVEILKEKARVILPDGSVIKLSKGDIKEGVDEDTQRKYRYFAFDGIEKGSEIEYMYLLEQSLYYKGSGYILQTSSPTLDLSFEIISPWNLDIKAKSYNGLADFEEDTTLENQLRIHMHMDTLPKLKSEVFAYYAPNLARFVYKLDKNYYSGNLDVISYGEASQDFYKWIHKELSKKENKALKKMKKAIEGQEGLSMYHKIENYVKANYLLADFYRSDLFEIDGIYKNKAMTNAGAIRLYRALFEAFELPYELVYTCDRSNLPFDEEFESFYSLQEMLYYLNDIDDYMDVTDPLTKIGYIDPDLTGNKGLFIESVNMGDYSTGLGLVKYIEPKPASFTVDTILTNLELAPPFADNPLHTYRSMVGYSAKSLQPIFPLLDEDIKKEISENLMKFLDEEAKVLEFDVHNIEEADFGVKPLVLEAKIESQKLVQKAGDKILVKAGILIGPQAEMYKDETEEERKLPIESQNTRTYFRELKFTLPEGFVVENLDDLKIDIVKEFEGEQSIGFQSSYVLEGNQLTVTIHEWYNEIRYPASFFEPYREVINAAADFNKVVLVLKKA